MRKSDTFHKKNGYIIIHFEAIEIEIIEKSRKEALDIFKEEFCMIGKIYGGEEDDKLSIINLRKRTLERLQN